MANIARGEVDIEFKDGSKFTMRPTFNAMEEFENLTNSSATTVLMAFKGNPKLGIPQQIPGIRIVAAAIWSGIRGFLPAVSRASAPKYEELGELIMKEGIENYIPIVLTYLTYAQSSDEHLEELADIEKKREAAQAD